MRKYDFGKLVILLAFSLLVIVPTIFVLITSFKFRNDFSMNPIGLPIPFTVTNYIDMMASSQMPTYFANSFIVALFTVTATLFFATMLAYAIMRIGGWKGKLLFSFLVIGMLIPAQVNMIPLYGLVSNVESLAASTEWLPDFKIRNTLYGLIMIKTAVFTSISVFILTGFMKTIPSELLEAAAVDGAKEWTMYYKICIPLSLPSVAATAIFLTVFSWNDLLYPLLFITDRNSMTLPLALLRFRGEHFTNYPALFAGVTMASVPIVLAFIFLQKWFIAGLTAGSVKG